MDAPLALYRRYRPDTFAQVIGQDHVTEPLRAALRNNRVNHAYLFSGPRGCGKTTSARILARALNCAEGPTEEPCGKCDSCIELATGGPGSVDVIEIDAASHGGVDDARELREQATFQPMRDRYKIYIIDEAHMVTTQGFNALLKIVEEPPEHVRFIFATTEPDKVIGTVRSRTHHYPFRLIPPRVLSAYLGELCEREGVTVEPAALPLIVRAGGGSARDTLSVLDQLIGGAGGEGVTYVLTAALLGFTPDSLLDDVVDAFAAHDAAAVFGVVDKVIETGQDPRRFTEDLLQRLRDLLIISAVPDASASGLIDVPEDQAERLVAQAARFGRHDLSRSADVVAEALTELKGTTAPRLLLELLCARLLLPGADDQARGLASRIDRLEKRMSMAPAEDSAGPPPVGSPRRPEPAPVTPTPTPTPEPTPEPVEAAAPPPAPGETADAPASPEPPAATEAPAAPAAAPGRVPPPLPPARAEQWRVRWPDPGRHPPPLARGRRGRQVPSSRDLDPAQPARPGRRRRRQHPDARLQQPRGTRVVRQRTQRPHRPAGAHRPRRPGVPGRRHRRPRRAAGDRAADPDDGPGPVDPVRGSRGTSAGRGSRRVRAGARQPTALRTALRTGRPRARSPSRRRGPRRARRPSPPNRRPPLPTRGLPTTARPTATTPTSRTASTDRDF